MPAPVGFIVCALPIATNAAEPLVQTGPLSFAPLVRKVVPAVVNIAVSIDEAGPRPTVPPAVRGTPLEKSYRDKQKQNRQQIVGAGSGFIVDPGGIIVTNDHVVGNANRIVVSLTDGTELPARVIGTDDLTDIAVIRVQADHKLPSVVWGDSRQVQVGDWILAAGNPFGLGGSVTAGIVSARGRELGTGPFDDFFQLDAPINPGNSGGPTFNMAGEVVAVNSALVSPTGASVGIGFAIPSEIAEPVVAELIAHGHMDRGWLGVEVDTAARRRAGALIASVTRGGPGARSGLKPGDVVLQFNNEHVGSSRELVRDVSAVNPGGMAHLRVKRQSQLLEISVTVGRRPPESTETDPVEK
ncbi:MAG TPA: trypsin-like peptidase domain-containing protein [Acetobacteraceae bacterium]|nr:trypsin-like peptidase domain-containing protein [Acetobacteraceae bacterium]